eukprot:5313615-Pyramimonas_sp.AAC.1
MRADPITKGSIGQRMILDAMCGKLKHDRAAARLSDERREKTAPSSRLGDRRTDEEIVSPTR